MDVELVTDTGRRIFESFGDFGKDISTAINNNLSNFSLGVLHPMLAAFGCSLPGVLGQVDLEQWEINGRNWKACIGAIVPKTNAPVSDIIRPPEQFFSTIEKTIRSQILENELHWFRSYYVQNNDAIAASEFIMDNSAVVDGDRKFLDLPVIPHAEFFSCRNFIILKQQ